MAKQQNIAESAIHNLISIQNQWTINRLFKRLKVHKVDSKYLFSSVEYREWVGAVIVYFKHDLDMAAAAIVRSLNARYSDGVLQNMLHNEKASKPGRDAIPLETAQLQYWGKIGKNPTIVFEWLEFKKEGDNILDKLVKEPDNDVHVADMLVRAMVDTSPLILKINAVVFGNALLKIWLSGVRYPLVVADQDGSSACKKPCSGPVEHKTIIIDELESELLKQWPKDCKSLDDVLNHIKQNQGREETVDVAAIGA
ncbi:unnamed protein product [Peronospora belbahrii]|uniref:Uncharacterized protein n=1 Tax=Peronospora belbahrii TaxID=622444 RepID=A0ABN8CQ58_9STRA|nr:unnamed protein product [Peronospora belbahrii]